jgi:hypothetical protein
LIDKQKTLAGNIALLILWVQKQGYKLTFGEAYRHRKQRICMRSKAGEPFHQNLERSNRHEKEKYRYPCLVLLMLITTFAACASTATRGSTGEYVDDSVITTKVKSLLAEDDFLKSFQISVETFKGTVQLSGFVNSQKAVDKAGSITKSVKGVKSIKNNLIVK